MMKRGIAQTGTTIPSSGSTSTISQTTASTKPEFVESPEGYKVPFNNLPKVCELLRSQNTVCFDEIRFTSEFDSGNMMKVDKDTSSTASALKFNVYVTPDAYMTQGQMKYRTWFYFQVSGVPAANRVSFTIKNSSNQAKLYKEGHQPVFRSSITNTWQRVESSVFPTIVTNESGIEYSISHSFNDPEETVDFAFTYPWSYSDCQENLNELEKNYAKDEDIYFHRTILTKSREGRNLDLITITSKSGLLKETLTVNQEQIFPSTSTPNLFTGKKYVFVSARVHPGEVPGSHVFNGMVQTLLDKKNECSTVLRDNFVFVMVPIINPDGVSRGHYRTDSAGQNLNRYYQSPSPSEQPEIHAIKELISALHQRGLLYCYYDLHAHATKKGSFLYANCMDYRAQIACNFLAKLISMNTPYFDFDLCNFTERNMYSKDKSDGLSKEGSGRVALYKQTNIPLCYTLECNYNMPHALNTMYNTVQERPASVELEYICNDVINSPEVDIARAPGTYAYKPIHYADLGRGMLLALLDLNSCNPESRVPNSPFVNLTSMKMQLALQMLKSVPYRFDNTLRRILRVVSSTEFGKEGLTILLEFLKNGEIPQLLGEIEGISATNVNNKRFSAGLQGGQLLLHKQQMQLKRREVLEQLKANQQALLQSNQQEQQLKQQQQNQVKSLIDPLTKMSVSHL